jgi:hypothetical protein
MLLNASNHICQLSKRKGPCLKKEEVEAEAEKGFRLFQKKVKEFTCIKQTYKLLHKNDLF